jgi:hypothetical protein
VPLASSPYATRRDSAFLDAAIIQLLVDHTPRFALPAGGAHADASASIGLADLAPGAQLQVSEPVGAGFAPFFAGGPGLPSALEEARALLLLGRGAAGAAPLRAALEWQPVAAHAGVKPVTLFLQAPRSAAAPYVADWDRWRDAGVRIHACYDNAENEEEDTAAGGAAKPPLVPLSPASARAYTSSLEEALLRGGRRMAEVCGAAPGECVVLVADLTPDVRARVTRELLAAGFSNERILFCEPY